MPNNYNIIKKPFFILDSATYQTKNNNQADQVVHMQR